MLWLEDALAAVANLHLSPSLFSGFTGVGWVLRHLEGRIFEAGEEDPGGEVESTLLESLVQARAGWLPELIAGLAGFGLYFLELLPQEGARQGVELVIDRMAEGAERDKGFVTWFTPAAAVPPLQKELTPAGCYNLGVSHGVPGVIGFLAAAHCQGVAIDKVHPLITGAVNWLLAQRLPDPAHGIFPSFVGPGIEPTPARLAWCYGDPGIAAVLLLAARSLGREDWEQEARTIARHAAGRKGDETQAVEPGLCHGTAGLGHLFNRFYQATGDALLREAAIRWLERTLRLRQPGSGVGGFRSVDFEDAGQLIWKADPGFLSGAAGIGLALLAAISPIEPEWDRVLLLSSPSAWRSP